MNQAEAQALRAECGGSITAAAKKAGMAKTTFKDRLDGRKEGKPRVGRSAPVAPQSGVGSVDWDSVAESVESVVDRESLDPTKRITALATQIPDGKLVPDEAMREIVGKISRDDWRSYRKLPETTAFRCCVCKSHEIFWGNDQTVANMRRKRGVE